MIFIVCSNLGFGQTTNYSFGTGFSKNNKKSIIAKMNNLIERVSEEKNCQKDSISIEVKQFYTTFYTNPNRHLPKQIEINVCGKLYKYKHNGLSGAVLYWLIGSWVEVK